MKDGKIKIQNPIDNMRIKNAEIRSIYSVGTEHVDKTDHSNCYGDIGESNPDENGNVDTYIWTGNEWTFYCHGRHVGFYA